VSDNNGDILIPNMAPGRYGIVVRAPKDKLNWMQTTTLEGAQDHDWWVMAGDTGYGTETTAGGELVPEVQFGFVPPEPNVGKTWLRYNFTTNKDEFRGTVAPLVRDAVGPYTLSGSVHEGCTYIGSVGGAYVPNSVPGANGAKDCGPINKPNIAVSGLDVGDQVVWAGKGNVDGTYNIPGLASGSYMVTVWDAPINHILETFNVTITDNNVNVGVNYIGGWFTRITGSVFIDTNGNGKRDAGEQGVSRSTVALRERDNTPMDQFTNAINTDANGNYDIIQAYPLSRFLILEHANPRYKPTGITVQACNEKKSTTYLGSAVDISILPVIGLCGRVDWAVEPYATGETGGIVGTITYGTTRNELDPADFATESWQPGISGIKVHLWAVARDAQGKPIPDANGAATRGPELADTYTSESFDKPTGCVARDNNGTIMNGPVGTGEQVLSDWTKNTQCVEAPLAGWQAKPSEPVDGATAQTVNGNYGFGTSKLNLYAPGDVNNPAPDHQLPLYADLATAGYPEQVLKADDYLVSIEIPNDKFGKPMYKLTREEDVNIFGGDNMLPQENFPASDGGGGAPPVKLPGTGGSEGLGVIAACAGDLHTVNVTNPDFIAGGGSPYEGESRPLCDQKLISVVDATQQVTNFELFTDVPLAAHFWGLILNDLGVSSDPTKIQYGEVEGLQNAPTGIYDWAGNLVDTAIADANGFYEAIEPSTVRINNPSPSGVSPGVYRFVGNDPGTRGHLNPTYDSRYRTIATNFQAWPGLWTVTDTAPTLTAAQTFNGQMTAVKCLVSDKEPQLFAVNDPVVTNATPTTTVTIKGRDFGTQGPGSAVLLGAANDTSVDPGTATPATVLSWNDEEITVGIPAASGTFAAGPRQLVVRGDNGKVSTTGITLHVLGGTYNPTVFRVGAGVTGPRSFNTDTGATLQQALEAAAALGRTASTLVVATPLTPVPQPDPSAIANDTTIPNPNGAYLENIVIHSGVKVQGVGPGGFRADGSYVFGSVIDGSFFNEGQPSGVAWLALVAGLSYVNEDVTIPDSATVTIVTPRQGNQQGTGSAKPAVDGFTITGGIQSTTPTNINILTGGAQTPYGGTGAVVTQGGGVYVHGGTNGLVLSNNKIDANSGSYAGAIRIGTPYANGDIGVRAGISGPVLDNNVSYALRNSNLVVSHNSITNNGGANLGGAVGLFSGTTDYRVSFNDVCGNFSAEYGGGISHYGYSPGGRIDHNRIWFNQSYDEGGAILVAGEVPPTPEQVSGGSGSVTIDNNKIDQNLSNDDGGGIRLLNAGVRPIKIENNEIVNNVSAHEGGGIALNDATDVTINNNTVARNVTTATAVTSDGNPAAAGLATAGLSSQLAQLVANSPSTPQVTFTNPVTYNNVFWDNRAGTFNGDAITGITDADANIWDIGSLDLSGLVDVQTSVLSVQDGSPSDGTTDDASNTTGDPNLAKPYTLSVHADARRSFTAFRQTVITDMTVNPWNTGTVLSDYRITAGSSAIGLGSTAPIPALDITGFARDNAPDSGAYELFTVPRTAPGAPTIGAATPDTSQLSVTWTPGAVGNPAATTYTARIWSAATGGTFLGSCSASAAPCLFTGLTNGTHYFIDVVASNAVGTSAPSARVEGVPNAQPPVNVTTAKSNNGLNVNWSAPVSVVVPTNYSARAYTAAVGGTQVGSTCTRTLPGNCLITGLVNGTTYYVDVTANYGAGVTATSSPRVAGIPNVDNPGQPVITRVAAVNNSTTSLDVTFTPGTTGGVNVTYIATAYSAATGGTAISTCNTGAGSQSPANRTCRIGGLVQGTTYWVEVVATNQAGQSVPSARVAGTPAGNPGTPTNLSVVRGGAGILVASWAAPVSTGGVPIDHYNVQLYFRFLNLFWLPAIGQTCTPNPTTTTTCTFSGLSNTTQYGVRVSATNTAGFTGNQTAAPTGTGTTPLFARGVITTAPTRGLTKALPILFTPRVASAATQVWVVRAFSTAGGTHIVGSCSATTKAGACTIKGLVSGRSYYVSVAKAGATAGAVYVAPRAKLRAL
jgi:hypothetical protein